MMRLVATCLLFVTVFITAAKPQTSDEIGQAFDQAITAINDERGKNNAPEFGCTQFFSAFYRANKTEQYVAFFEGRRVRTIITDANQRHYISFELPYTQLRTWGHRNFHRRDRLVLVFTTTSSGSDDITSFSARLFGPMQL